MKNEIDILKKKLIYRSLYRGTKEMDKLIGGFVKSNIDSFDYAKLKELEKFLDIDDDTLYRCYNNQLSKKDLILTDLLKLFKEFDYKK